MSEVSFHQTGAAAGAENNMVFTDLELEVLSTIDERFSDMRAKVAFWYLLSAAVADDNFRPAPSKKGILYRVQLFHNDDEGRCRYAFIANKGSVLFYLRKPAVEKFKYDLTKLNALFGEQNCNNPNLNEITIRISNCSIPDDHINPRRSALSMARSVLREVRNGARPC